MLTAHGRIVWGQCIADPHGIIRHMSGCDIPEILKHPRHLHLLCAQPPLGELGWSPTGFYSGSSLAAAFTTGTMLQLKGQTGKSCKDCLCALIATRDTETRAIRPEMAYALLRGQQY